MPYRTLIAQPTSMPTKTFAHLPGWDTRYVPWATGPTGGCLGKELFNSLWPTNAWEQKPKLSKEECLASRFYPSRRASIAGPLQGTEVGPFNRGIRELLPRG